MHARMHAHTHIHTHSPPPHTHPLHARTHLLLAVVREALDHLLGLGLVCAPEDVGAAPRQVLVQVLSHRVGARVDARVAAAVLGLVLLTLVDDGGPGDSERCRQLFLTIKVS